MHPAPDAVHNQLKPLVMQDPVPYRENIQWSHFHRNILVTFSVQRQGIATFLFIMFLKMKKKKNSYDH